MMASPLVDSMPRGGNDLPNVQQYILELLAQDLSLAGRSRLELSPVCIARNIGYKDNDYVGENCRLLVRMGLLTKAEDGPYYSITDDGLAFVEGEGSL